MIYAASLFVGTIFLGIGIGKFIKKGGSNEVDESHLHPEIEK